MLTNLKRILLTQYIGAIITAYLGVQAILGVIQVAVYVVMWCLEGKQVGVFGGMSRPPLDWSRLLPEIFRIVFELIVAAGLVFWLYRSPSEEMQPEEDLSTASET